MANQLTAKQRTEYAALKAAIAEDLRQGLECFLRAGEKLLKIKRDRLYREEFDTFEDFCRAIAGHSKTYANNLIRGYAVVQQLVDHGETVLPGNERVARELARHPQSRRLAIWRRALQIANGKRPTCKLIMNGNGSNDSLVLTAMVGTNAELFQQIAKLYIPRGSVVADVTFGQGVFWRNVDTSLYDFYWSDLADGIDCRSLPYEPEMFDVVVSDPPYVYNPSGTTHGANPDIVCRYGNGHTTYAQVFSLYVRPGES